GRSEGTRSSLACIANSPPTLRSRSIRRTRFRKISSRNSPPHRFRGSSNPLAPPDGSDDSPQRDRARDTRYHDSRETAVGTGMRRTGKARARTGRGRNPEPGVRPERRHSDRFHRNRKVHRYLRAAETVRRPDAAGRGRRSRQGLIPAYQAGYGFFVLSERG